MSDSQQNPRTVRRRNKRKRSDVEHQLQVAEIAWTEMQGMLWPELTAIYAIVNQGDRGDMGQIRMTAEGLKRGMPDLHFPVARRGWNSLYVENKTPSGRVAKIQKERMTSLQGHGNLCYVIRAHRDFVTLFTWYLGHEDHTSETFSQGKNFEFVVGEELAY